MDKKRAGSIEKYINQEVFSEATWGESVPFSANPKQKQ